MAFGPDCGEGGTCGPGRDPGSAASADCFHLPGEDPLATATRELKEETGLESPGGRPQFVRTVYAGSEDGARGFRITCFGFLTFEISPPTASAELQPEWLSLEQAWDGRLLTAGTRRVLRALKFDMRALGGRKPWKPTTP